MKISIDKNEIMELTKLAPPNVTIYDIELLDNNRIKLYLDVKMEANDWKTSLFSFVNNFTPRKEVSLSLNQGDNASSLKITLDKVGVKYLWGMDKIIHYILKTIPKLNIGMDGVDIKEDIIFLDFDKLLDRTPFLFELDNLEIAENSLNIQGNLNIRQ